MKLDKQSDQLESLGVQVFAVSTDQADDSQKVESKTSGNFTFIYDRCLSPL